MPDAAHRGVADSWSATARMPFAVDSLPSVRHELLADVMRHEIPDDAAYDAALVLAELVSNALKYGRPMGDGALHLRWGFWDGSLHVQVTDGGAPTEPGVKNPEPTETSGRGLAIVDAISADWGVERGPARTTVWVVLATRSTPISAARDDSDGKGHAPTPDRPHSRRATEPAAMDTETARNPGSTQRSPGAPGRGGSAAQGRGNAPHSNSRSSSAPSELHVARAPGHREVPGRVARSAAGGSSGLLAG